MNDKSVAVEAATLFDMYDVAMFRLDKAKRGEADYDPKEQAAHARVFRAAILARMAAPLPNSAGVREALGQGVMAMVVDHGRWSLRFEFGKGAAAMHAMRSAADMVRALPIPEAPDSVEPVAWMYTHINGFRSYSSGKRDDYMAAQSSPDGEWTETPLYVRPEPDTIGSNFGNGGGLDPVVVRAGICQHRWSHAPTVGYYICIDCGERHEHGTPMYEQIKASFCPASPGFGGGDLPSAIRSLPYDVNDDYDEVCRGERERIIAALAGLPPVKKSVSPDECRRDLQALGAAISRRCWQSAESAYNALRDRIGQ